jgi:hypothetical protein
MDPSHQCCGTVIIYCGSGSGSYFGKVLVPVPAPFPFPVPVPDPYLISTFKKKKICTKTCLFNAKSSIVPRKLASNFLFDFRVTNNLCWIRTGMNYGSGSA